MLSEILLLSIKSAFVLALLYVPYTLVLRKESFFRFNRVVLLSILVLALVLPLCNFSALSLDQQPVVHAAQSQMIDVGIPVAQSENSRIYHEDTSNKVSWFEVVGMIYFVGMTIVLMFRVWQLLRMGIVLRRNCVWTRKEDGVIICCHSDSVAPCSWLKYIAISEEDYTNNGREIILHEKGHIINLHSFDIILLTIVQMVQWWNPVSYMLGLSLRDIHEYEADDHVLTEGVSAQAYQMLLIKKAVGSSSYAFANNFNHSLTKKRIAMMINKKSNPWMCTKALYIIPVAFVALSAFATPKFVAPIEEAVNDMKKPVSAFSSETHEIDLDETLIIIDGKLSTKADLEKMEKTPYTVVITTDYEAVRKQLASMGFEKIVYFNGSDKVKLENKYQHLNRGLIKKTIVEVNNGNDRGPGDANGSESKRERGNGVINMSTGEDEHAVFTACEQNPAYPGGKEAINKFLAQNIRYPKLACDQGVQGKVLMSFIIGKDGSIEDVYVSDKFEERCAFRLDEVTVVGYKPSNVVGDENGEAMKQLQGEVARVVRKMQKWSPAIQVNKPVRFVYILPVNFMLQ